MAKLKSTSYLALVAVLFVATQSAAAQQPEGFPDETLQDWQQKSFVGQTSYKLITENGVTVLKGTTDKSASLLFKRDTVNLEQTPWLDWVWKVDSTYEILNETEKSGDDFPARLYVSAQIGLLPWESIAINYVWSSNQPAGTTWVNPHTDKSVMVAIQSGDTEIGQWVSQRRNVLNDFKTFFDTDVTELTGYAIMVDGDNSAQSGSGYFGNIRFSAE